MDTPPGSQPSPSRWRLAPHCTSLIPVLCMLFLALGLALSRVAMAQPAADSAAVPVPAVRPVLRELVEYDEYTGRFAAVNRVDLRARVSGYLSAAGFTEGQVVKAGDLLFVIDQRPFQIAVTAARAELEEMRAGLELARTEADRARTLRKNLVISQEDLDQRVQAEVVAASRFSQVQAALARAELNLEFTEVRAPISGRIGRRLLDVGNMVIGGDVQGTLLTNIVQEDPIHFYFEASEADFLRYARLNQSGERVASRYRANEISVKLLDEDEFLHRGVMDFVDNQLSASTGTVLARALLANPDGLLQPGLFGRIRLPGSGLHEVVLVPDEVIQFDQSRQFVFVISDDGMVERRWVTTGPMAEGMRILREGLDGSELVAAGGFHRMRAGMQVAPQLAAAPAGAD
ncbi:MAG: efflux RND transporter periplasmic adaptor subunit [Halieaceae bacterium]|nr:efflux RND transporter periplasmic adaptor subunit [Halieaceae bacterium]